MWKGKDEQDQAALEVPVVPIYIQEKVHPQALVENLRDTAKPGELEPELTLFSDFNGMGDADFDKKVDFYHHDQHWSNPMILGDSLLGSALQRTPSSVQVRLKPDPTYDELHRAAGPTSLHTSRNLNAPARVGLSRSAALNGAGAFAWSQV